MSLPCLAWADKIGASLGQVVSPRSEEGTTTLLIKTTAVVAAYVLNVSMQPLQINLRASLMDKCPPHQQTVASLWITRYSAFGSVLVTSIAYFASPSFKPLAVSSCFVLGITLVIHGVETRRQKAAMLAVQGQGRSARPLSLALTASRFRRLFALLFTLPSVTRRVCRTQMFAWFGWFTMLYYMNR